MKTQEIHADEITRIQYRPFTLNYEKTQQFKLTVEAENHLYETANLKF